VTVRIVTDSTADLSPELVEEHGLTVVPLSVLWGDEELLDGIDITSERFFKRLVREKVLPTTSQPSPGRFRETYERLIAEGATEILSIHLSQKLSGTLESARQGAEGITGARIIHIDSRQISLALGLGVIEAARLAHLGVSADTIQAETEDYFRRTRLFVLFDTLEYLRRGGRIGRGMEVVGSLLQVKPIATIEDGEITAIGRVRTKQKAIEALISRAADLRPFEAMAALHATTPEDLGYLITRLGGLAPDAPLYTGRVGPVIGVHAGPGMVGFCVVTRRDEEDMAPFAEATVSVSAPEPAPVLVRT